ncbi:MAG: spinster family MFS transporter [Alphaproteobacteria bacterium]
MSNVNSAARESSQTYAWYVVGVLMVAYTFSFIDRQILSLMVGPIKADLGISDTQIGLLQGLAFAIFYTALGFPIGRMADRRSRRGIIAWGIFVWSLMTAACGLAKSYATLFLARMGVGVGEAALSPAAYSMIADYFPKERLGTAISLYATGIFFGASLALIVGGAVVEAVMHQPTMTLPVVGEVFSWQATFFIVGLPGILVALLMITVREPARRGAIAVGDGVAKHVPLKEVWRFGRTRWRTYLGHNIGFGLMSLVGYALLGWVPEYLIRIWGWSRFDAGLWFGLVVLVAGVPGIVTGGWLADRYQASGRGDGAIRAGLIGSIGLLPFAIGAFLCGNPWLALVLLGVTFFFQAMTQGVAPAALQLVTPNQMRAQMSALWIFCANLIGLGIGPVVVGLFTDRVFADEMMLGYSLAATIAVATPISIIVLALTLKHFRHGTAEADAWAAG